jgi:hypothetical protein
MSFRGGKERMLCLKIFASFFSILVGNLVMLDHPQKDQQKGSQVCYTQKWISFGARFIETLSYDYS